MADDFVKAVEDGLKLSKRLYFGKDRPVTPPKVPSSMDKSGAVDMLLPKSPMVYAVITDPKIVDNPDIPSYQPYVHGRCDPPSLIPLQMNAVELDVDCYLDTAFVRVSGTWRVHCVMGSKSCDCRIAVPMGDQGSILGVEAEISGKSYHTQLIALGENDGAGKSASVETGSFLKPNIFTLTLPQIDGGSYLSIRLRWSQKLSYRDGEFSVNVPFKFPEYVTPAIKKIPKREKIHLNVNAGTGTEVLCNTSSHPLKQLRRDVGKLGYSYESEVLKWSNIDFDFSYTVSPSHIFGGVLLQSPSVHDVDQREMFCMCLLPGTAKSRKVFKKDVIFIVDISKSMQGKPLEDTKNALAVALSKLDPGDSFNIIAFNGETYLFSTSMELATKEAVERAHQWIGINFIAGGSTNICAPLTKAVEMLTNSRGSIPIIFLVTDGAVEDERQICDAMKSRLTNGGSICPRIYTFGIGSYCNHYFLRMLAMISRGYYGAAYDLDSIEIQMQKLFTRGFSSVLANIAIDTLKDLDEFEALLSNLASPVAFSSSLAYFCSMVTRVDTYYMYPSRIPDLSSESPLIVSGRYQGKFPDTLKAKGFLGDLSNFVVELKLQLAKDLPLDRICAKQQIDLLTAQAWFSEDKRLEEKVSKMSVQTGVLCEYTRMIIVETDERNNASESPGTKKVGSKKSDHQKILDSEVPKTIMLQNLGIGFGDLTATAENFPPGSEIPKLPEVAEIFVKAASNCCSTLGNKCCCLCCIECCNKLNDQCVIVLTQLCTALACFGCFECCSNLCCCGQDG
ncbi:VWFA domain-containing protein [Citrus sinensis]|uniref:VWFA domain-containing protein n=1 Tax=Citrus sinensis TaxID=2711 RepID=A0ACB8P2S3_CITSI|nr:VWFA domain-containing protein [Citrus sinensis]